ncbi:MAG: hypothetical protein ACPG7F_12255, partial [Aggregatilineales bacterium]
MTTLICIGCRKEAQPLDWRCKHCQNPLDFAELLDFDAAKINTDDFTLWRYGAMLPVEKRLSLGEGMTPLVEAQFDDMALYL